MSATEPRRPAFISSVIYKDNRAALEWLQKAFGFEPSMVLTDAQDNIVHAEMSHGDGAGMVSSEYFAWSKSPLAVGGVNTQRIHVRLEKGIDEHCAHARQAGAKIEMDPTDQFYGDRCYSAEDPEGHHWTFSQAARSVSVAEMEQATGFKFKTLT